jgi:hypothetical protein
MAIHTSPNGIPDAKDINDTDAVRHERIASQRLFQALVLSADDGSGAAAASFGCCAIVLPSLAGPRGRQRV